MYKSKLIFDVGMHHGRDTEFYLNKGFDVVAIEANPALYQRATEKFADAISAGRLAIYNVAISDQEGEIDFFVNEEKDDWSSIYEKVGGREDTRFHTVKVRATTLDTILQETGIPYYIKIDIEQADLLALKTLSMFDERPKFISCEGHSFDIWSEYRRLGFDRFQVVNQQTLPRTQCPFPAREGTYVDEKFTGHHSGLFGKELPDDWLDIENAVYLWLHKRTDNLDRSHLGPGWYDLHATRSDTLES